MDIALLIALDNPTRALKFVDALESKCGTLGAAPGVGTARADLGDGIRMLPQRRCLIFYRDMNKGLRIERILHGAPDIGGGDVEADDLFGE